ncbi:MAG: hypothetical protein JSU91_08470 [Thermoplasmatales archaeon]|nr:MAG: hypothetical protein JSU91_08470 [Thermoplasmatales archaeon]
MDRTDCAHFEYKYFEEEGKKIKIPSCKIGRMKGVNGCEEYCEWFELVGPEIPNPPTPPEPPGPLKPP